MPKADPQGVFSLCVSTNPSDVRVVPIADIRVGPQPRVNGIHDAHVAVLSECLDDLPPVKLVETAEHGLVLAGGHHTLCAYQNAGRATIPAEIIAAPADGDLLAVAFHENALFGLAYTAEDRNAFAAHLLRLHPERSDREIGREAGRSQPTVARIRAQLEASATIEQTDTRVGRGGYRYAVTRENRQSGELPPDKEPLSSVFTSKERREQRRLVRYFERLATALDDGFAFDNWQSSDEGAEACRAVLGDEAAEQLGEDLGPAASNVLDLAIALGYQDDES